MSQYLQKLIQRYGVDYDLNQMKPATYQVINQAAEIYHYSPEELADLRKGVNYLFQGLENGTVTWNDDGTFTTPDLEHSSDGRLHKKGLFGLGGVEAPSWNNSLGRAARFINDCYYSGTGAYNKTQFNFSNAVHEGLVNLFGGNEEAYNQGWAAADEKSKKAMLSLVVGSLLYDPIKYTYGANFDTPEKFLAGIRKFVNSPIDKNYWALGGDWVSLNMNAADQLKQKENEKVNKDAKEKADAIAKIKSEHPGISDTDAETLYLDAKEDIALQVKLLHDEHEQNKKDAQNLKTYNKLAQLLINFAKGVLLFGQLKTVIVTNFNKIKNELQTYGKMKTNDLGHEIYKIYSKGTNRTPVDNVNLYAMMCIMERRIKLNSYIPSTFKLSHCSYLLFLKLGNGGYALLERSIFSKDFPGAKEAGLKLYSKANLGSKDTSWLSKVKNAAELLKQGGTLNNKYVIKAAGGLSLSDLLLIMPSADEAVPDTSVKSAVTPEKTLTQQTTYEKASSAKPFLEGLSDADISRIAALGCDLVSTISAFEVGGGSVVSAASGLAGAGLDLYADFIDPSTTSKQALGNLFTNLGLTAIGLVPGGRAANVLTKIAKMTPKIMLVISGTTAAGPFVKAIQKGQQLGFTNLSRLDLKDIYYGIRILLGGVRWGEGARTNKKYTRTANENEKEYYVRTTKGKLKVSKTVYDRVTKAANAEEANKIVKQALEKNEAEFDVLKNIEIRAKKAYELFKPATNLKVTQAESKLGFIVEPKKVLMSPDEASAKAGMEKGLVPTRYWSLYQMDKFLGKPSENDFVKALSNYFSKVTHYEKVDNKAKLTTKPETVTETETKVPSNKDNLSNSAAELAKEVATGEKKTEAKAEVNKPKKEEVKKNENDKNESEKELVKVLEKLDKKPEIKFAEKAYRPITINIKGKSSTIPGDKLDINLKRDRELLTTLRRLALYADESEEKLINSIISTLNKSEAKLTSYKESINTLKLQQTNRMQSSIQNMLKKLTTSSAEKVPKRIEGGFILNVLMKAEIRKYLDSGILQSRNNNNTIYYKGPTKFNDWFYNFSGDIINNGWEDFTAPNNYDYTKNMREAVNSYINAGAALWLSDDTDKKKLYWGTNDAVQKHQKYISENFGWLNQSIEKGMQAAPSGTFNVVGGKSDKITSGTDNYFGLQTGLRVPALSIKATGNTLSNYIKYFKGKKDPNGNPYTGFTEYYGYLIPAVLLESGQTFKSFADYEQKLNNPTADKTKIGADGKPVSTKENGTVNPAYDKLSSYKFNLDDINLPDILAYMRMKAGLTANEKYANELMNMVTALDDPEHLTASLRGDYLSLMAGEKAAGDIMNLASKTYSSDAATQAAAGLLGTILANKYRQQGLVADATEYYKSLANVEAASNANAKAEVTTTNTNRLRVAAWFNAQREVLAAKESANYSQIKAPFWAGIEKRMREAKALRMQSLLNIAKASILKKYQEKINTIDKAMNAMELEAYKDAKNAADVYSKLGKDDRYNALQEQRKMTSYDMMEELALITKGMYDEIPFLTSSNSSSLDTKAEAGNFSLGTSLFKNLGTKPSLGIYKTGGSVRTTSRSGFYLNSELAKNAREFDKNMRHSKTLNNKHILEDKKENRKSLDKVSENVSDLFKKALGFK